MQHNVYTVILVQYIHRNLITIKIIFVDPSYKYPGFAGSNFPHTVQANCHESKVIIFIVNYDMHFQICTKDVFLGLQRSPFKASNPRISLFIFVTHSLFSSMVLVVMVRFMLGQLLSLFVSCSSNSISLPPLAMSLTCFTKQILRKIGKTKNRKILEKLKEKDRLG